MSLGERKQRRYEELLDIQRRIQLELDQVETETLREVDENRRHERSVNQLFAQSEPTTPPEYNTGFPTNLTRPNRYSAASLASPPGIASRPQRSSTQLTSPPVSYSRAYVGAQAQNLPSQSVPGSRRQSDDEEEDDDFLYGFETGDHRSAANRNRNSMPVPSRDRKRNTTDLVLGPVNTTGFLFDDEEKRTSLQLKPNQTSPPDTKTFLQVQHTADGFPKLIRREESGDVPFSASSAALDLAASPDHNQQLPDRISGTRHRVSLPPTGLGSSFSIAPLNSILANANDTRPAPTTRSSVEVKFSAETKRSSLMASPSRNLANGHSSYSTNDIPTLKSINGETSESNNSGASPPAQSNNLTNHITPEQNTSVLTRINSGPSRQNQTLTSPGKSEQAPDTMPHGPSILQANAPAFGPFSQNNTHPQMFNNPAMNPFGPPNTFYGGFGMHAMNGTYNNPMIHGSNGYGPAWPNQQANMYANGNYAGYPPFLQNGQTAQTGPGAARFDNSRVPAHRRPQQQANAAEEAQAKYNSIHIEQLVGDIYTLCKDQHGCRFLQKKLEERNESTVSIIFNEVNTHMIDLMIDPFGNYLCQKLMESANDDQRLVLITNASPAMTQIALNQHGTRALQKMIECVKTPEHTQVIIEALRHDVVALIQDLNGNHVIQKCLNHLSSQDAQFIFDAVGRNCITVGTHRHGCCVLQRCIDHADGLQKGALVDHVIDNSYTLVQDPFGNYVVQYILDLAEPCFIEPLCKKFLTHILELSKQKFSSNVIEKCIRVSTDDTRRLIVHEMMSPTTLEKMLRDGFGNYVIQTAMDYSDDQTKALLIEDLRNLIPNIRNTPHGRRIFSKISDYDNRMTNSQASMLSPLESVHASVAPGNPSHTTTVNARANRQGMIGAPPNWSTDGNFGIGSFDGANINHFGGNGIFAPTPQRNNLGPYVLNGNSNGNNHPEGFGNTPYGPGQAGSSYSNGMNGFN